MTALERAVERVFLDLPEQRQAIHAGHVDVAQDDSHARCLLELRKRLLSVPREQEAELAVAYLATELVGYEQLQIGLVVHDQNGGSHRRLPPRAPAPSALRGSVMTNSVNSPGSVFTSSAP